MSIQIVENHVDFPSRVFRDDFIHKIEKLATSAPGIVPGFDLASDHIQGSKQGRRSIPFVTMAESVHGFAVRQAEVTLSPLQRLDMRLFIDAKNHRIFRRIQIETDHIGCFWSELRIGWDTPTAPSLQLNTAAPQDSPYMVFTNVAQFLRQKFSVPLGKALRRFFVQHFQYALFGGLGILLRFARPWRV